MWVIANGAPKGGSTWIVQLLEATGRFERVPLTLQQKGWQNSSVTTEQVPIAIAELAPSSIRYLSKQHWPKCDSELLSIASIKVLNIIRDMRDVLVSRYHHDVRLGHCTLPLGEFIVKRGRPLVRRYCQYHRHWIEANGVTTRNYHVASYEYLSFDLLQAAAELYAFVDLELSDEEIERSATSTLFSKKKVKGQGTFFRRGEALAFSDEIGDTEEQFILDCCRQFGFGEVKRSIRDHSPQLEPYLRMTDIGLDPAEHEASAP